MTTDQIPRTGTGPADQHLADARLHLERCLLAIRAAVAAEPRMCVPLGTPFAVLSDVARELEGVR